jgi:5'-nucleotidase
MTSSLTPRRSTLNPRILLTNDDGINAPGLKALEKIARQLSDDVWIVAPEQEQSGASHSLTLHMPLRVREVSDRVFAVTGTPTDCVMLAASILLPKERPSPYPSPARSGRGKRAKHAVVERHSIDLVLSGVNRGSNAADDITYSGTVAAAMEGALIGIRSIALSQLFEEGQAIHWETAEKYAAGVIKQCLSVEWTKDSLVNLNFPDCAPSKVKGAVVAKQGKRVINVPFHQRVDPKGRPYYWLGGDRDHSATEAGVDVELLHKNYITVTGLHLDLTQYELQKRLSAAVSLMKF